MPAVPGLALTLIAAHDDDHDVGIAVGVAGDLLALLRVERDFLVDADSFFATKFFEVGQREKPDVARVVPIPLGRRVGLRGFAFFAEPADVLVIPEVREADDRPGSNPEHFVQNVFHVEDRLQRFGEHDEIELLVGKRGQPVVQVPLDHVDSPVDAALDISFIQFDSHDLAVAAFFESG